jgi:hypothetical protein
LIQETCTATKIPFKFRDDLSRYTKLLKVSHGDVAQEKIDIQEVRLKNGIPTFLQRISEVENKLKEKLTEVDWVGRKDLGSRVADIDLIFGQNRVLPISAKSGGPGTERNLGGDSLKGLLGYDSSNTIKKMKEEKLVKGYSPTDVEAKVTKVYENYSMDWRITAIVESKIDEVIEE